MKKDTPFGDQYLKYAKELWGRELILKTWGFVTYDLNHDSVYIADMYIELDERDSGRGKQLEAEVIKIALKAGKKFAMCAVHRTDQEWKKNFTIYTEHCGYYLLSEDEYTIRLIKPIGETQ